MTDREKAIVMAYTGCTMLAGDKLGIYYEYVQEKLGRRVMTHELAYQEVQDAIKEAAKEDFIAIAKADNGWISVEKKLPTYKELGCEEVLALFEDGSIASVHFDECTEEYFGEWQETFDPVTLGSTGSEWYPIPYITHWMSLPETPKEG